MIPSRVILNLRLKILPFAGVTVVPICVGSGWSTKILGITMFHVLLQHLVRLKCGDIQVGIHVFPWAVVAIFCIPQYGANSLPIGRMQETSFYWLF